MFELFEDDHPGPLAEDEPVAVAVEDGRLAFVGSLLRVERAVSLLNPVTPNGWIMLCVPPESITSASPRRINSTASPIACELAAQAVRQLAFGPLPPRKRLARWPAGVPGSCSASRMAWSRCNPSRVNAAVSTFAPVAPAEGGEVDEVHEAGEVLLPFARAEVHAEPGAV